MAKRQVVLAVLVAGIMGMLIGVVASPAYALSFTGNYFNLSGTHGDTSTDPGKIDNATVSGLVDSILSGTSGTIGAAPTWSGTSAPSSGPITDTVGGAHTAIQWWTTHTTGLNIVTPDTNPVRSDALPFSFSGFFPTGKSGDGPGNGYLAVHWIGTFQVATTAHLSLSPDDDAWLFLSKNGGASTLTLDNGGVKAVSLATTSIATLSSGLYTLDLFFADRHPVEAALSFTCDACDPVSTSTVPEPATLLLFGTTLVGLGAVVRRGMQGKSKETA